MWVDGIEAPDIEAHTDPQGFPTLRIHAQVSCMLAAAFEADIQTLATVALVYERLDSVADGRADLSSFSGNSCTVTMRPNRVLIENDILDDEETYEMSTSQYRMLLEVWSAYLGR